MTVDAVNPTESEPDLPGIGGRVREIRLAADLTQQEMADQLGVTRPYVNRLERGHVHDLSLQLLFRIAALDRAGRGAMWVAMGVELPHDPSAARLLRVKQDLRAQILRLEQLADDV